MKKYIVLLLTIASASGFASDYKCVATLALDGKAKQVKLDNVNGKVRIATMESFQFNSVQTDDETIVLTIFNLANRAQSATATTFIPGKNRPSNLSLRLADGVAMIDCEST